MEYITENVSGIAHSVLISLGHFPIKSFTVYGYPERLAIKFHNTAVLHSENLPPLRKEPPFCDLHCHPQLMTFKYPPTPFCSCLSKSHTYNNYDKALYTDPFYH